MVKNYIIVDVVRDDKIDQYLKKGWEIIETTRTVYDNSESLLNYHIGYPIELKIRDLKIIIEAYEKYGFKEELYKKIAESNGHDLEEYDTFNGGNYVVNDTVNFMEEYEFSVNNNRIKYYKKLSQEELKNRYGY